MNKHKNSIHNKTLLTAIENTFNKRNAEFNIDRFKEIVEILETSDTLKKVFINYRDKLEYTKQVEFDDTIKEIKEIIHILEDELVEV